MFKRKVTESIIGYLKNRGANINTVTNTHGRTILNITAASLGSSKNYGNTSIAGKFMEVLLRSDADPNMTDNEGVAPLMPVSGSKTTCSEDLQLLLSGKGGNGLRQGL